MCETLSIPSLVKQRSIILVNKFLSSEDLPVDKFQLLGATALLITTKVYNFFFFFKKKI